MNTARAALEAPGVLSVPHLGYVKKDGYELCFGRVFANRVAAAGG